MKLQRTFSCIAGVLIASGLAASQALAGQRPVQCDLVIEVNALRGGSPTVVSNGTKDITAKARIAKGSAVDGTTIDTQLMLEAISSMGTTSYTSDPNHLIRLGIGKGGQGQKVTMTVPKCQVGEFVRFRAKFFGNEADGDYCESDWAQITKTCN